jgi:hypothetical protein
MLRLTNVLQDNKALNTLNIGFNHLEVASAKGLANLLRTNNSLRVLNLGNKTYKK